MMHLLWLVLWSVHPHLALSSGPDHCTVHESNVSPLLESLQCYNDYESSVYCKWKGHKSEPLQLWYKKKNEREPCVAYSPPGPHEHGTVQCRYTAGAFSIGIKHTVFFLANESVCSSVPHKPVALSQHLRARTPVDLRTHDAGDGAQRLRWSSPYPSSSSLHKKLTYQLSYRADRQHGWTVENVTNTSVKLEKRLLLPGRRYEARVRARASVGQWSNWSQVVSWQTQEDTGQPPSLHCVLNGETEVMCSWEVSSELARFITYQLCWGHNQTALPERCCENPAVRSDVSGTVLTYSCSLNVTDPAHTLLQLLPTRNAKTFAVFQHIRPKPPQQVEVKDKNSKWIVEWTEPSTASKVSLYYQVCYWRTQAQESCTLVNASTLFLTIPRVTLVPSQQYQVMVRSVVVPGEGSIYEGIPSEWSNPEKWTSHPATWSVTTILYVFIGVFVAAVFLTFYCTFPTCQRRVVLWVDSVPSPGKSSILSEIKSATSRPLVLNEDTSICKVLHFDTVSTCSSDVSLWPPEDTDKECLGSDEGFWKCETLPTNDEKVNSSGTSSMSFSGPYIFCRTPPSNKNSADAKKEEKGKEEEKASNDSPAPVTFALYQDGYVCLPSRATSRSTQDLVSHSGANTNTQTHNSAEQHQQCPDATPGPDKMSVQSDLSEPTSDDQPPAYTSWPQGGHMQTSGYCFLPQPQ